MELTELKDRIRFIREGNNLSKSEFARRLDISPAYVTKLESGLKTKVSSQLASVIQYHFGINRKWLFEGVGEKLISKDDKNVFVTEANRVSTEKVVGDFSEFERLLFEISATYINLPVDHLEKVLKGDFARLTQALGVDGCILYVSDEPHGVFSKVKPLVWFLDEHVEYNKLFVTWLEGDGLISEKKVKYSFYKWSRGEHVPWSQFDDGPPEALWERQSFSKFGLKSALSVPIMFDGYAKGVVSIATTRTHRTWSDDLIPRIRLFGEVFINAFMRKRSEEKLQNALSEIKKMKEQFEADYLYLREEISLEHDLEGAEDIVGKSDSLKNIINKIKQVAPTDTTVILLGETGTGKGLLARAIHNASNYRDRPMIQVNCAALAPTLIESELFGHEKGAYTGAVARRIGRFEAAEGTTLFLDEIGDLPFELQPKLLRALEEGEFERVGGNTTIRTRVRVIAATSKDLAKEVKEGKFRSDLWYRLNIFPIFVPPLRDRVDDIPLFIEYFSGKHKKRVGKKIKSASPETVRLLQGYSWPGNIRELNNVIERAVIMSSGGNLKVELPLNPGESSVCSDQENLAQVMEKIERERILKALEGSDWIIGGPNGAARRLGFTPSTLRYRLSKLDIKRSILFEKTDF